uniref:Uncharacterized protein n=1 Tax=Arundo donax TaxID=35708 RepID=A0A0A9T1M7_ARUDO
MLRPSSLPGTAPRRAHCMSTGQARTRTQSWPPRPWSPA